jgi:hypothetical protein
VSVIGVEARLVTRVFVFIVAWMGLALLAGCDDPLQRPSSSKAKPVAKKTAPAKKGTKQKKKKQADDGLEIISRAYDTTRNQSQSGSPGQAEDAAVKKVGAAIRASLDLGPTLVVWLIDRTPSAQRIVGSAVPAAKALYEDPGIKALAAMGPEQLLTATIAFDDKAEFVLDPPSADLTQAAASLDKFPVSQSGSERTFAAVKAALGKYLNYRTDAANRREVLFVIITDEAGDDGSLVDELVQPLKRNALPVYCIGSPAPWGQVNPLAADPKKIDPAKTDDSEPVYGPESIQSERVDIEMPQAMGNSAGGGYVNLDFIDSGFGPYALEMLCRAGGGQFLAIRPEGGDWESGFRGGTYWPSGAEMRFESESPARYAPEYVSAEEHRQLLAGNKARQALHAAAQLSKLKIVDSPDQQFAKGDEAAMKRTLDRAQQYAARNAPVIDRFYDVLAAGEGDRPKLTVPRLQAQYDLAMGRILAAKARIDGYNSMIAALKRGKTFTNASSSAWVIEPADSFETESTIKKLAERAKTYLERVAKDHPGTPWAKIAEAELAAPMGWTWKEI